MTFKHGERVELVFTDDPHTNLVQGDKGTVIRDQEQIGQRVIDIAWDNGSTLSMIPSSGDEVKLTNDPELGFDITDVCEVCNGMIHMEEGRWYHTRIEDDSHEPRPEGAPNAGEIEG